MGDCFSPRPFQASWALIGTTLEAVICAPGFRVNGMTSCRTVAGDWARLKFIRAICLLWRVTAHAADRVNQKDSGGADARRPPATHWRGLGPWWVSQFSCPFDITVNRPVPGDTTVMKSQILICSHLYSSLIWFSGCAARPASENVDTPSQGLLARRLLLFQRRVCRLANRLCRWEPK